MDAALIKKFQTNLNNMRAKVIEAKGEAVKGLSPVAKLKNKESTAKTKTRGVKS